MSITFGTEYIGLPMSNKYGEFLYASNLLALGLKSSLRKDPKIIKSSTHFQTNRHRQTNPKGKIIPSEPTTE